jgi:hypothetical protein
MDENEFDGIVFDDAFVRGAAASEPSAGERARDAERVERASRLHERLSTEDSEITKLAKEPTASTSSDFADGCGRGCGRRVRPESSAGKCI